MELFIFAMLAVNDRDVKQVFKDEATSGLTGSQYQNRIWQSVQPLMSTKLFPWDWATANDTDARRDAFIAAYGPESLHMAYKRIYDILMDKFMASPKMFKAWCGG